MAFSSSGATMSMKEPASGATVGPGVSAPGVAPAVYATFNPASQDFAQGEYSQQQREYLHQRNLMSAEQHSQQSHSQGAKGSTVSTHDFLSLYADNSSQYAEHHDTIRGLSSALTTKDFLQPLERGNHAATFRDGQPLRSEKHSRQQEGPPHGSAAPPAVVERLLPGGVGPYNGGHGVPNYARVSKGAIDLSGNPMIRMVAEGNVEALRSRGFSSSSAGPMSSREDHDARNDLPKDQDSAAARADNLAYWSSVRLKFGMLPPELGYHAASNNNPPHNVMENVQPPIPNVPKQWPQAPQGLIDMAKRPIRVLSEDDEDDEEEYGDRPRETRKETFPKADAAQKVDGKAPENRGGTPRSKHSATEQRRRSKINDRFQMLRELVPHSDQKRDKASFLLEVIEYIQVLQDKVRKFETAEHGRHQERLKNMVRDLCKRGGSGPGDTTIEASCMDALAYAKEYGPSVSGLPMDVKQVCEATDSGRPRAVPNADENGSAEVLPPGNKAGHHGSSASHNEKESSVVVGNNPGPLALTSQHQVQIPYGRGLPQSVQPKQQIGSAEPQLNPATEGQVLNSSSSTPATASYEQDKANDADALQLSRTQANGQQHSQGEIDSAEQPQQLDLRQRPEEDAGNGHAVLSNEDQSSTKPHAKPDRQHFGNSPRLSHAPTAIESSQANWQSQHGNTAESSQQQKEESHATVSGQDPLSIQGGVINVSSVYSQGLLDTLTRALQSSGLDLSQANISVQIDLGKSKSSAALPPVKAVGIASESSGQSHQSQGNTRQAGSFTDPEHPPLKRPKLEMEL